MRGFISPTGELCYLDTGADYEHHAMACRIMGLSPEEADRAIYHWTKEPMDEIYRQVFELGWIRVMEPYGGGQFIPVEAHESAISTKTPAWEKLMSVLRGIRADGVELEIHRTGQQPSFARVPIRMFQQMKYNVEDPPLLIPPD